MVQDRLIVVVYKGLLSCHILITKLFSSRRPSVELDWAREKKVLDADPTMVIFVISIRRNSCIYSKFWSILYSSNIQITGKTVFEEDGEGGYRSGRNLLFIMIKCM